jgi:hypothetical protein
VLARLPRLRLVTARSTGHDHIDVAACTRRGSAVSNVPSYGESTVADDLARRAVACHPAKVKLALVGLCLALVFLGIYDVAAPHVRRKTK